MASISRLPLEIIGLILSNIPDIFTLLSATKTSHAFRHGLKLRETHIITSCFRNEWGSGHFRTKINHAICGRILRELLALSVTELIDPAPIEKLLREVWAPFAQKHIEEALLPICLAIARSYVRIGQTDRAITLLTAAWDGSSSSADATTTTFPYSIPLGIGRDFDDADRLAWAQSRRRAALYPVGRFLAALHSEAGDDTTALRAELRVLRAEFRRAPVLLVGMGQVALFPWEYMVDEAGLLEDGVWFNSPCGAADGSLRLPRCVKALVRISSWAGGCGRKGSSLGFDAVLCVYRLSPRDSTIKVLGEDALYESSSSGGGRDSLKVYGGSLPGDTIPIYETEDNNDKEATAATTMTISQRRQRQNQLVELLLSGRREDGPVRKQEVLAAAGEYNAERVTVDLLVRDHHNHGNSNARHVLCIHAVLRTYHLATVVRLLRGLGDSLSVSEEIVMAAAENQHSGRGIVKFLLDNRWDEVRITEDVVRAAARNSGSGKQILELLLERGERLTWVSEDALRAAREEVAR